jgi:hypothetical protein
VKAVEDDFNEHAPVSLEGAIAWALLTEGAAHWRRAGMDGAIIGLNLADCLARPSAAEADAEALEYLLLAGEAGALTATDNDES